MTRFIGFHMLREKDPLSSQFPLLPKILSPPQEGMKPEDAEHADEKGGHDQESPVEEGLFYRISMRGVSDELNKMNIGSWVAFATRLDESLIRNEGLRVLGRQDAVKSMAVCTACHKRGIAQLFNFSVVALVIGLGGDEVDLVPFHHFPVTMALLADLGMELFPKGNHLGLITFQQGDFMEAVAVGTRSGIGIPRKDGLTVNALRITVIRMTGRAFLDDAGFVPFPGRDFVDLFVAIPALDIVDEVNARIMLRSLFLVTPMARHGFRVDLGPFRFEMRFGVGNVPMATVTGKGSVNRLGKLPLNNLVSVTFQALGIVNAFGAVFSSLDGEFFSFLCRFGRRCDRRGRTGFLRDVKLGRPRGKGQKK